MADTRPPLSRELADLHEKACERGERSYLDPATGYTVFTRLFHLDRGSCCGSGCRHCPYGDDARNAAAKKQSTNRSSRG